MKLDNYIYKNSWNKEFDLSLNSENTLIIVFSSAGQKIVKKALLEISNSYPNSVIIGASTAGEISQDEILDDTVMVSVVKFENTIIRSESMKIDNNDSAFIGENLAQNLFTDDLQFLFVISDGLQINGSQLAKGINTVVKNKIPVTGGLAADKDQFIETWTIINDKVKSGYVSMLGFYGKHLQVRHGSKGGWDRLGLERLVTRSIDNVLYELDGQPALSLYKTYLGNKAEGLPSTGLLFPLEIKDHSHSSESHVRTILGVNEEENSITFAGDIPEGSYATLMKANMDRLIDGSIEASNMLDFSKNNGEQVLSIAISCVGRRLVLKQRTEEELEGNMSVFPKNTQQIGFYSYGEISPHASGRCDLHNQTMTLTSLWESHA